jgi:alanyl-tRNA synthetase
MTERKIKNTEKIFEKDSTVSVFDATVLSCEEANGTYRVVLDRTAFFPTGGGQSCDSGTLNGTAVSDVKVENGEIIHVVSSPLAVGERVRGVLDYAEREEKMRSHTAEHILSSVLNKKYGLSNVGFHLGSADTTCDFDGVLTLAQIYDAEDEVNRIIRENHRVYPVFPSENELKTLEYRSKLELTEDVRIVMIGENGSVDKCACCAPHVSETGNIGYFKIVDFYKYKGGTRVHILTGIKAVEKARDDFEGIKTLSAVLSAPANARCVSEAAERIREENEALEREISTLNGRINSLIVDQLDGSAPAVIFDSRTDSQTLRSLCLSAAEKTDCAAVFGGENGKFTFVIAGSGASEIFTEMKKSLNVRGGGREVIFGTVFESKSEIMKIFDGENI